jgi:trehalose-phosphatase
VSRPAPILADAAFWERVKAAPCRFLGLDYDGTLAPLVVDRMQAVPTPGIGALLRAIAAGPTRVAVISGRLLAEVDQLLGVGGIDLVGSHGYERRRTGEPSQRIPLTEDQEAGLSRAAGALARQGLAARLERKAASLAFHTRGLAAGEAAELLQRATEVFAARSLPGVLDHRPFDGGVELRAVGVDKGTALEQLLDELPREALAVYLGDDRTDEDAFAAVQRRFGGVGVKVGPASGYATRAGATLADCGAVVSFLERWRAVTGAGGSPRPR